MEQIGQQRARQQSAEEATTPGPFDVITGKGSLTHSGNILYRGFVAQLAARYGNNSSRASIDEKSVIVDYVVGRVRSKGGRFLKFDKEQGVWQVMALNEVHRKLGRSLRYHYWFEEKEKVRSKQTITAQTRNKREFCKGLRAQAKRALSDYAATATAPTTPRQVLPHESGNINVAQAPSCSTNSIRGFQSQLLPVVPASLIAGPLAPIVSELPLVGPTPLARATAERLVPTKIPAARVSAAHQVAAPPVTPTQEELALREILLVQQSVEELNCIFAIEEEQLNSSNKAQTRIEKANKTVPQQQKLRQEQLLGQPKQQYDVDELIQRGLQMVQMANTCDVSPATQGVVKHCPPTQEDSEVRPVTGQVRGNNNYSDRKSGSCGDDDRPSIASITQLPPHQPQVSRHYEDDERRINATNSFYHPESHNYENYSSFVESSGKPELVGCKNVVRERFFPDRLEPIRHGIAIFVGKKTSLSVTAASIPSSSIPSSL